jgi:hypothetical protein
MYLLFLKNNEPRYINLVITVSLSNNIKVLDFNSNSNSSSSSNSSLIFSLNPSSTRMFSTWNAIISPDYFKKKKIVIHNIKLITNEEERKKEKVNLKHLKEL